LPEAMRIVLTPPPRARRMVAYAIGAVVVAAVLWSIFGDLRLFAIAIGEFEASGGNQVVEPVEAGEVSALFVKNGSYVEKDSVVVQLDPTVAQANKAIVEAKLADTRADAIRSRAAASAARAQPIDEYPRLSWPNTIPADVRTREEMVLHADLAGLAAAVAALQAKLVGQQSALDRLAGNVAAQRTLLESRTKSTAMHEELERQGWDSRAVVLRSLEPLRLDQVTLTNYQGLQGEAADEIAVINSQISEAKQTFVSANIERAAKAEREADSLAEQLKKADLALGYLSVRAPVSGLVQWLAVVNIGQNVRVGQRLMEIVPDGAPLNIVCYVLNTDIGFVRVGQSATIKIDTFPYTRYGTISGHVVHVGADAVTGSYALSQQKDDAVTPTKGTLFATTPGQQFNDLVFPVTVIPDETTIKVEGRDVPLTAGMTVAVEIETERQRAISYILYPLERVFYGGGLPKG
jgi:hemolysin D